MDEIKTYKLDEVAQVLKVTRRTIYNYVKDGKLPAVKVGSQWRVTDQALRDFLSLK